MHEEVVFTPPRQPGLMLHLALSVIAAIFGGVVLLVALQAPLGLTLFIPIGLLALAAALVIIFVYRSYALSRAKYTLAREGITIQWGLRAEEIPMPAVLWCRQLTELEQPPAMPRLQMPGAVLGARTDLVLGQLEYLASDRKRLVLLATEGKTYVISPDDPEQFLESLQEVVEMGSLTALDARSIHPASLLVEIASDPSARLLVAVSFILGLAVMIWVGVLIPSLGNIPVGFAPDGLPRTPGPAVRVVVLGIVSTTFLLADWILGAYYFRQPNGRVLAYIIWLFAAITPLLFLAVLYMSITV